MSTRKRIIPKLEIKNNFVVKGIELEGVKKIGEPIELATKLYDDGCDEIILSDIVASLYNRVEIQSFIEDIRSNVFVPICAGGGVNSLADAAKLFSSGADKVFLNTGAVNSPQLIKELVSQFGSSSIVIQIDTSFYRGEYHIFTKSGREFQKIKLMDWIAQCISLGVGEILVTSIRFDGKLEGPDWKLIDDLRVHTSVPILYSGGIESLTSLQKVLCMPHISGACVSSALYNGALNLPSIRSKLLEQGVDLRKV